MKALSLSQTAVKMGGRPSHVAIRALPAARERPRVFFEGDAGISRQMSRIYRDVAAIWSAKFRNRGLHRDLAHAPRDLRRMARKFSALNPADIGLRADFGVPNLQTELYGRIWPMPRRIWTNGEEI
jgi:hypothetical protein